MYKYVCVQKNSVRDNCSTRKTQNNSKQNKTKQHQTKQHQTKQNQTTQHNTTQHNTTQHNTTQNNPTQHDTKLKNRKRNLDQIIYRPPDFLTSGRPLGI